MKGLLIRLKPENFSELTALIALYRPGPLDSGMVNDFVECKHGRKKVEYLPFPHLQTLEQSTLFEPFGFDPLKRAEDPHPPLLSGAKLKLFRRNSFHNGVCRHPTDNGDGRQAQELIPGELEIGALGNTEEIAE